MTLPRDREHDLDRLLGEDGGEFGALYRRLSRVDPPRRLDRAVLGEAARAVHGRPPRRQRWLLGLGSAAGVVLAAGIAWHMGQDALREQTQYGGHAVPNVVPVEPITEAAPRRREHANEAQNAPPPASVQQPVPAQIAVPAKPASSARKSTAKSPTPLPAAAPAATEPASSPVVPAPFPAAAEPRSDAATRSTPAPQAAGASKTRAADELDQAMPAAPRAGAAPSPSGSVELRRDMQLAPEDWLAHIRQLLHQGRRQQATESLRLFRLAHPDWQLPDELRPLLD
ncbi:hypothetical protein [Dokdonella soli]|uniref:DUF3379 family protein n=1 Tax=Dokdonella soli TaxID=529810 RepID=A0ABN1IDQ0_9GAMM